MGRRKKEPANAHRAAIAAAAKRLFRDQGMPSTTMDDIAKEAGYSKATLYVYFRNKEDIIGTLTLESMERLYACIDTALSGQHGTKAGYDAICRSLANYQEQYPFYFQTALHPINVDFSSPDFLPVEKEIYDIGERINARIARFLQDGIGKGDIRADIPVMPTVFSFWAMLSGLILMAAGKQAYLTSGLGLSRAEFLQYGFDTLYRSISAKEAG